MEDCAQVHEDIGRKPTEQASALALAETTSQPNLANKRGVTIAFSHSASTQLIAAHLPAAIAGA